MEEHLFTLRVKPFTERAYSIPLGHTTEEQARYHYGKMIKQLFRQGGGYVLLFEDKETKYPILAQRVRDILPD